MLEHLEYWLKYNADGPWWAFVLFIAAVVALAVLLGALIRDWFNP